MTTTKKYIITALAILLVSVFLLAGCHANTPAQTGEIVSLGSDSGKLVLSVNPEIAISYDQNGDVTSLTGINDDGKEIVSAFGQADGTPCETVTSDLVRAIYEAGYFDEDVDGNDKNIIVQLIRGSIVPRESFLEDIKTSVVDTTKTFSLNASVIDIGDDDYDESYTTNERQSPYISKEKAMQIAAAQAGVPFDKALFSDREFDFDNGTAIYELEFFYQDTEYQYDIDAVNGTVLSYEHEKISGNTQQATQNTSYIGTEKAKSIALSNAGVSAADATFTKTEFDFDDHTPVYEIDFYANGMEYEYEINAATGAVIKSERDYDDDHRTTNTSSSSSSQSNSYISAEKAKSAALSHAGVSASNATFKKVELDHDDRIAHYEIEFYANGMEYEYEINAATGAVIKSERDYND